MREFGQKVRLEVIDEKGGGVFSSGSLRVDFHVKALQGVSRAHFKIYNLNAETIRKLCNGERYCKVYTQLHDHPEYLLDDNLFYVNNSMTEKLVPDSVTNLFSISSMEKNFTQKELSTIVNRPSLDRLLRAMAKGNKDVNDFKYVGFPEGLETYIPPKGKYILSGNIDKEIKRLGKNYNFTTHIKDKTMVLQFHPNKDNEHLCNWQGRDKVLLLDVNMRANVDIGTTQVKIKSNLDPRITPPVILDTSALITATSSQANIDFASLSKDYLKKVVAGSTLFSVISTEHKGSNYTKEWITQAIGTKISTGTSISTYNWFGGK